MIIAVDGYSSTGKSTVAKLIAARLGIVYIDTGAMYRAVTLFAIENSLFCGMDVDRERLEAMLPGISVTFVRDAETGHADTYLNGVDVEERIRGMEVSERVSAIAAIAPVRRCMVECQRSMAADIDVIMDGRDIGSAVFPDADVKFFMTASREIRARRRYDELLAKGENISYSEVEANIEKRDYIDTHRDESPLVQVPDAVVIDTGGMSVDEVVDSMISVICERTAR